MPGFGRFHEYQSHLGRLWGPQELIFIGCRKGGFGVSGQRISDNARPFNIDVWKLMLYLHITIRLNEELSRCRSRVVSAFCRHLLRNWRRSDLQADVGAPKQQVPNLTELPLILMFFVVFLRLRTRILRLFLQIRHNLLFLNPLAHNIP
jgi:hypothetical protein